jgi:hypothetical protein
MRRNHKRTKWGVIEISARGIRIAVDSSSLEESEKVAVKLMERFKDGKTNDSGVI